MRVVRDILLWVVAAAKLGFDDVGGGQSPSAIEKVTGGGVRWWFDRRCVTTQRGHASASGGGWRARGRRRRLAGRRRGKGRGHRGDEEGSAGRRVTAVAGGAL
jgi:hypothetical protein